jgi:HK97 family phage prohead protease
MTVTTSDTFEMPAANVPGLMHETNLALKMMWEQWNKEKETEEVAEFLRAAMEEDVEPFEGASVPVFCKRAGIRVNEREVDFIASTADIDSHGDIVEQDFILGRFEKNPIILFAHNSRALPIGTATNVGVRDGVLKMTVRFASKKANPVAEHVFQLIKEGILKAMSIGFIPHDIRRELRDDKEVWILSKNELIESSVVPIPANQNALAEMKAKALEKFNLTPPSEQGNPADGGKDVEMTLEELQKQMEEIRTSSKALVAENKELTEANKAMAEELDALKARYEALEGVRNEEKERANKAEVALVERDLDELIGKKISPHEKASLVKLAGANRELFDEQIAAIKDRPDMKHCEPSVLPDEKPVPRALPRADGKSGDAFARIVTRHAGLNR